MDESKLSLTSQERKQRFRSLRRRRVLVQWLLLASAVAIYVGLRLGARPLFVWLAETPLWRHTLSGHPRVAYLIAGVGLEALGLFGISLDRRPYWYAAKNGVETFGAFMWRVRELGLDLSCVIFGAWCLIRASLS